LLRYGERLIENMKISEIKEILKATIITGDEQLDKTVVAGGSADLMDDVLSATAKNGLLLTGLTSEHVIRTAQVTGVVAIVFVRGKKPDEQIIDLAKSYNLPLLMTRYSLFVASGRLYMNGLRGLDGSW
jgi:predicted transcriptional regulator